MMHDHKTYDDGCRVPFDQRDYPPKGSDFINGRLRYPGSVFRIARPVFCACAAWLIVYFWTVGFGVWSLVPLAMAIAPWMRDRDDYRWMDRE